VNVDAHVPYGVVRLLVECGRLDVLRAEAGKGDWWCAEALGDEFVRPGEPAPQRRSGVRAAGAGGAGTGAATHVCTRYALWTILIEEGRPEEALGYLDEWERDFAPDDVFRDRIWLLEECGRREEALDRVRAQADAGEDRMLRLAANVLDGLGRTDEAIELLRPHAASPFVGNALAEMLIRRGDVDEAMAVVDGRETLKPWPDPWAGVSTD
jgi:tetratricopeptide (TPR) repeat protein